MCDTHEYLSGNLVKINSIAPFNHMDAFVLSILAYLPTGRDMRGYEDDCTVINPVLMTVGKFCNELISQEPEGLLTLRFYNINKNINEYNNVYNFCKLLAKNNRYKDLVIEGEHFNNDGYCQFFSYSVRIGKNIAICYRGTDGTYEGWYEDFKLLDEIIPSQSEALSYFYTEANRDADADFYMMGHSKGGNLALFASISASIECKGRIKCVYNFDGPGFNMDFLRDNILNIYRMRDIITSYYVENTIVGNLLFGQKMFADKTNIHYIKSSNKIPIIKQHCYYSWQIKNSDFIYGKESRVSNFIDGILDTILLKADREDINNIIKILLELLDKNSDFDSSKDNLKYTIEKLVNKDF